MRCVVTGLTLYLVREGLVTGHWSDTVDRRWWVLRRLVTGWTQSIVREAYWDVWYLVGHRKSPVRDFYDVWSLVRYIRSSERGSEMFGHLLVDYCAERGCWSQAPDTEASLVINCFYSYWSNATVSLVWLWYLITISVPRNYLWPIDIKFVPLFSIYFRSVTPVSWFHWSRSFCLSCFDKIGRTDCTDGQMDECDT